MNIIEKYFPAISLSGTLIYICEDIVTQGLGAVVTPITGLLIGTALFFTTQKIIELVIDKFGSEHIKSVKLAPWLIAPSLTTGILALTGIVTTISLVAVIVAIVSPIFFYYQQHPVIYQKLTNSEFTFDSIAGMEDVKKTLRQEVIFPIQNRKMYVKQGLDHPRGIIFHGKPGCGKTHFAKALAGELKLPFIHVTAGDVASPFIHGTSEKIRAIFTDAISKSPCILFMDEIDGIAPQRRNNNSINYSQHSNEELTELITQVDKAIAANVTLIGATNCPELIDPALVRNGRFDTKIEISLPDDISRRELFEMYLKNHPTENIQYDELVEKSKGKTCSDIKSMVETAARNAIFQTLSNKTKSSVPITMQMLKISFKKEVLPTSGEKFSVNESLITALIAAGKHEVKFQG